MQNTRLAFFILFLAVTFSCTKEKSTSKLQFKATASEKVTLSTGVFMIGDATTNFSATGQSWESAEINIPDSVHKVNITLSGSIAPGYAGTLKAQIFINGELKAEETAGPSAASTIIVIAEHSF